MDMELNMMRGLEARMLLQEKRAQTMHNEMRSLKLSLDVNTLALQEFIDISKGLKFGLKMLSVIEAIALWVTKLALAVGVLWGIWTYVIKETIKAVGK